VLVATTLFAFIDRQVLNLIAPQLQAMLRLSDLQLGALQGLGLALFASAAGYPIGWLADRFGRRRILAACIVLWSTSTAACAMQHTFAGVFAATAGIAVGESALTPIVFSLLPDLFPERERNWANFVFFAAALLGAAVGFAMGGMMLEWLAVHRQSLPAFLASRDNWRAALILAAIPGPAFALLLGTIRVRAGVGRAIAFSPAAANLAQLRPFMREHWPVFACFYGMIAAYTVPMNAGLLWLPVAMPRIFGTPSSAVGMQLGISVAVATIVGLLLPALGIRLMLDDPMFAPLRLARLFIWLAAVPSVLFAFAPTPLLIYVTAAVQLTFGLGVGALMPGLLQQISPSALRSRLLAVLGIVTALAQGLSPLLVGALSGWIPGPRGILSAIAIVSVPCWLVGMFLIVWSRRHFSATTNAVRAAG
jgi:MFS family permease